MNIISGIISGFKAVFGTGQDGSNNVMKVAGGIGGWIDGQKFTEQEQAEHSAKMVEHFDSFMKSTVAENTQRSRTRRDLAIWIIRTEIGLLVASVIAFKLDKPLAEYMYQVATDSPMGYLTLGVGAFFFGAHIVRQVKGD